MNFTEWNPVYETLLDEFGFERHADERARDLLADLTVPFDLTRFERVANATVAIAGAGPSLDDELPIAAGADATFAASTAVDRLLDAGVDVDLLVTDLDKNPDTARELTDRGVPVAAHAHGDNVPAIETHVPRFDREHVLATTQASPAGPVRNFGGFTDGDRAAFLADHLGAGSLVFPGWDVDDPSVGTVKRHKLVWAERLLYWLETRRDESFAVLDGRRESIDTGPLPI